MDPTLVAAVDVGATKTLVLVTPLDSAPADARFVRLETPRDPIVFLAALTKIIDEEIRRLGGRIVVAGCAAPGPLDRASGIVSHSPNLGWRDFALGPELTTRLGVPVILDDDANLGALGEATFGAGRDVENVVYATVSSGIGAGIVVGGRVLRGAHGLAGEFGHLTVDPDGPVCGCGRRGCIEAYAGGESLARRAIGYRADSPSGASLPKISATAVFEMAAAGVPWAQTLVDEAIEALGRGLAALAAVIDPAVIILGGSIGLAQPVFIERALATARARCLAESGAAIAVRLAKLGERSVLLGAWADAVLSLRSPL